MQELQAEMGLSLIFIAHDLAVVRHISHRVMVMYLGQPMELAHKHPLYKTPQHPYTQALLSAIPIPDPAKERPAVRTRRPSWCQPSTTPWRPATWP